MTTLASAVDGYLELRRGLGFKMDEQARSLPNFVAFLRERGAHQITTRLALSWAVLPTRTTRGYQACRLAIVRGFARYCHGLDPRNEVPPTGLLSRCSTRRPPYIYTEDDVRRLTRVARALPSGTGLRGLTYATLLSLLAVTGMRIGEAVGLDLADVDLARALLTVRGAKFGKSRFIPLHSSSVLALRAYLETRSRARHRSCPAFLVSESGARLSVKTIHWTFKGLLCSAGVRAPRDQRRPRLHDFRHRMAVNTLIAWYRNGEDVDAHIPELSTYLGHVKVADTYWYLSAVPELLGLAADRAEARQARERRP